MYSPTIFFMSNENTVEYIMQYLPNFSPSYTNSVVFAMSIKYPHYLPRIFFTLVYFLFRLSWGNIKWPLMRNKSLGTSNLFHLSPFSYQETEAWRRKGTFLQSFAKNMSVAIIQLSNFLACTLCDIPHSPSWISFQKTHFSLVGTFGREGQSDWYLFSITYRANYRTTLVVVFLTENNALVQRSNLFQKPWCTNDLLAYLSRSNDNSF